MYISKPRTKNDYAVEQPSRANSAPQSSLQRLAHDSPQARRMFVLQRLATYGVMQRVDLGRQASIDEAKDRSAREVEASLPGQVASAARRVQPRADVGEAGRASSVERARVRSQAEETQAQAAAGDPIEAAHAMSKGRDNSKLDNGRDASRKAALSHMEVEEDRLYQTGLMTETIENAALIEGTIDDLRSKAGSAAVKLFRKSEYDTHKDDANAELSELRRLIDILKEGRLAALAVNDGPPDTVRDTGNFARVLRRVVEKFRWNRIAADASVERLQTELLWFQDIIETPLPGATARALQPYLFDEGVELSPAERAWVLQRWQSPPEGSSETVGQVANVFHETHAGGKGNSVWWVVTGGQMKVVGCAKHTGKDNSEYSFHTRARTMPSKYKRK